MRRLGRISILVSFISGAIMLAFFNSNPAFVFAQQPTGSVPTVTGTHEGSTVTVDPSIITQIKVYAGPSSSGEYPAIGILLANETVPALGRAKGKPDWIQIYYPGVPGSVGWVWSIYLINLRGDLKVIDIPATPTPISTPTINPTLVQAFIGQQTPTRLPTFTPPAPIALPQFSDASSNSQRTGVPTGLLILSLALFGFFGVLLSYLRGR